MTFTATAAYPYIHEERATLALRAHLRELAAAAGERPDWSTLAVVGPTEVAGARGVTWFEWVGTVEMEPQT